MPTLFDPLPLGPITMRNRCVLSPMTRARCDPDGVPTDLMATYFAQRAGAGLMVTGSARVSPHGAVGPGDPCLLTDAQVAGWRRTTDAVHAAGGVLFAQLAHGGSSAHSKLSPTGQQPVSPSGVPIPGDVRLNYTGTKVPREKSRPLETREVEEIVAAFGRAAARAIEGGCDGVDIHACSGYLLEEFLCSGTNKRTDKYGGSAAKRARFVTEIIEACAAAIGIERVGVKVSPEHNKSDVVRDEDPRALYAHLADAFNGLKVAYVQVADNSLNFDYHAFLRPKVKRPYFAGVGFAPKRATALMAEGGADAIVFGRLFISNPDLPERIRRSAVLNPVDPTTIYPAGPRGLIDYPALAEATSDPNPPPPPPRA